MAKEVSALPPASDRWEQLAVDVAAETIADQLSFFGNEEHRRWLNSISSPPVNFREVFDHVPKVDRADWERIIHRLEALPAALTQFGATLEEGRAAGEGVAARQVTEVIRQCRLQASDKSAFTRLAHEGAEADTTGGLGEKLEDAINEARTAYGAFADYLEGTYLPAAGENDGVGRERYLRCANRFLGTALDPEELYAWGWEEIASLRARMQRVAGIISPGGEIDDALTVLKSDPARAIADQSVFIEFVQERLDLGLAALSDVHFEVPLPIRTVEVALAPPGGSLGAYYVGPSEDFSRPGRVWYSLVPGEPVPLYDEVSTAYHEGFPGHHLQLGIQASLSALLSRFHRLVVWKAGSGEGWALYAERLMDELGFLEVPDYEFGYLASQMLRACRVVIDIGIHCGYPIPSSQPFRPDEPWTFEAASHLLMDHATLDADYATSEAIRYFGWPGQAISYKVGEQTILDLRRQVGVLPEPLQTKEFHARVLQAGAIGLDLLRKWVLA